MDRVKRIMGWKPDTRLVAGFAVAALGLLLIPLLRIALYSVPYYDDYLAGRFVRSFLWEENSLRSALQGLWYSVKSSWYAWQGTYSATFLNSLVPVIWGEQYYFIGPVILILFLPVSVCVLAGALLRGVLKADQASCIAVQAVLAAMVVVLLYSPQQGFYWYVGGVCYVGLHSFLLVTIAAWARLLLGAGKVRTVLLVLWSLAGAALAGGGQTLSLLFRGS